jgi:hypothetical protein
VFIILGLNLSTKPPSDGDPICASFLRIPVPVHLCEPSPTQFCGTNRMRKLVRHDPD